MSKKMTKKEWNKFWYVVGYDMGANWGMIPITERKKKGPQSRRLEKGDEGHVDVWKKFYPSGKFNE